MGIYIEEFTLSNCCTYYKAWLSWQKVGKELVVPCKAWPRSDHATDNDSRGQRDEVVLEGRGLLLTVAKLRTKTRKSAFLMQFLSEMESLEMTE